MQPIRVLFVFVAVSALFGSRGAADPQRKPLRTATVAKVAKNCVIVRPGASGQVFWPGDTNVRLMPGDRIHVRDTSQTVYDSTGYFVFAENTIADLDTDNADMISYTLENGTAEGVENDDGTAARRPSDDLAGRRQRRVRVRSSTSISPSARKGPGKGSKFLAAHRFVVTASVGNLIKVQVHCRVGSVTVAHGSVRKLRAGEYYSYTLRG